MAKFATVLCILLVVSGSYGSFFDTLTSSITNKISAASTKSTSSPLAALSSLANVASSVASAATSGDASSVVSSITNAASDLASAATSGDASSVVSSITNAASDLASTATSGDASSVVSSLTDVASGLANAAGSTSGIGSLLSGITGALTSVTNSASSNPIMSLITGASTTWITTVSEQIKTQMNAIMGGFKSAIQIIESAETVANDATVSSIGQFGIILDSFTNTDLDVSSCTSMASEVEEIMASAVINATGCTRKIMDTLQSDVDITMTTMTNFLEDLYSFAKQVNTCSKNFWTSLGCMANVASTTGTQAINDFSSTMKEVTVIMSELAGVQSKIENCGVASAQKQLQSKLVTSTIEIAECVAQLGAAGISSGSSSAAVAAATKVLTSLTG